MEALSEQLKDVMDTLHDIKGKQKKCEADFHQQHSELNSSCGDGKTTGNYQLTQLNSLTESIACIEKKI